MFAKIFSSIYDSSIANNWKDRVVFQDMLVLADKNGIVDMTPEAIARRTAFPLKIIKEAINNLEAPDPSSRTPDHDGRRIVRLDAHRDWGWKIVNFVKYRESATKEMLRMAEADRKRAYRARNARFPSSKPPTQKQTQKQRGEADMSRDMSGTSSESPRISVADKISKERYLDRINKELETLKEADLPQAVSRRKELRAERAVVLGELGLKA